MSIVAWAVLLVPFASAALVVVVGHRAETAGKAAAVGGSALGMVLAWTVALTHLGGAAPLREVLAATAGGATGPSIQLAVYVDPLSALLLVLATGVAFLVQLYSLGYLARDPRYPSYAALVSLFTGAMTMVVTADDWWMLLVGWELMGACSYFLIAHHWELADARAGAVKAFLITRTADLGMLFAILVLGERFGTYRISTTMRMVAETGAVGSLWLPALLLTVAVAGNSAQVPFHTWLPDAMPGPTPISALIHAATMVAAGVFLVARAYPLFVAAPVALSVLAVVAAVTMLLAAVHALRTHDLKRVLAWSTVSQLAYMFGALAAGAWSAAVLHLMAHGAFKALLFLAAGAVVHSLGGATSMDAMGGLRGRLPATFVTMTLGFAALAGVVPLAGFFTKDAVVTGVLDAATGAPGTAAAVGAGLPTAVAWLLLVSMLLTAVLTVAYSLRAWLLVFFGEPRSERAAAPHGVPATMAVPLVLLAVPTVAGGVAVLVPDRLLGPAYDEPLVHLGTAVATTALVVLAAVAVLALRGRTLRGRTLRGRTVRDRAPGLPRRVAGWRVGADTAYDLALVRPVRWLAGVVRAGDRDVIDAYAAGAGASARGLAVLLGRSQTGSVRVYLMVVVVGAAAVAVAAGALA